MMFTRVHCNFSVFHSLGALPVGGCGGASGHVTAGKGSELLEGAPGNPSSLPEAVPLSLPTQQFHSGAITESAKDPP